MAIVISKEDLKGVVTTAGKVATATPIPTGTTGTLTQINQILTQVDILLKNPMVQQFLVRIGSRYGLIPKTNPPPTPVTPQTPATDTKSNPQLNPENIYSMILGSIDAILKFKGNITLTQLKTEMTTNKVAIIELIKKSVSDGNKPKS